MNNKLHIIFEDEYLRAVYKNGAQHSALGINSSITDLYQKIYNIDNIDECGLVYRLDYTTQGILLFAKSEEIRKELMSANIKKTYNAISSQVSNIQEGFYNIKKLEKLKKILDKKNELEFTSYFRSFGQNSKYARPVFEEDLNHFKGKKITKSEYSSKITIDKISSFMNNKTYYFTIEIQKGARHQIRSTLSSLSCPIIGDTEYNSPFVVNDNSIKLICRKLVFFFRKKFYNIEIKKR